MEDGPEDPTPQEDEDEDQLEQDQDGVVAHWR